MDDQQDSRLSRDGVDSKAEGVSKSTAKIASTSDSEKVAPTPSFPEGGAQAWMTVLGAWIVQIVTFGYINSFGVYQGIWLYQLFHRTLPLGYSDFYVREYLVNNTSSQISWIGSVQLLVLMSSGAITGVAFDRGYFYHMVIGGSVLFAFCLFMLSLARPNQYYQVFLAQGLGMGISFGLTYIPTISVCAHYFARRRAMAMGLVASGSSIGAVIHPIMLNLLFHNPKIGFATGVRISAAMNSFLLLVACTMMRTRLPPKKRASDKSMASYAWSFMEDKAYVFAVIGPNLNLLGLFFPIFYIQLYSIQHGLDATFSFYSLSILNGASVAGRIIPTILAHKGGVFNLLVLSSFGSSVLVFALYGVKTVAGVVVFSILYGFFSGGLISLLGPALASLAKDYSEIGARLGICYTFMGVFALVGSPISGALLTSHYDWSRAITFSAVCMTAGATSLLLSRMIISKRKQKQII